MPLTLSPMPPARSPMAPTSQRRTFLVGCFMGLAATHMLAFPESVAVQIRASERGTVSQVVDGTRIEVDYSRPRVRGREPIFGDRVCWGGVWTPGANLATSLEVDRPITIEGHRVEPGKWSVWFVVAETGPWEVVLDPEWEVYHEEHPEPAEGQVRFDVEPTRFGPTEVLTWWFPEVSSTGTQLSMAWSDRRVDLTIGVEPSLSFEMSPERAARYTGTWTLEADWIADEPDFDVRMEIVYRDGILQADWQPFFWGGVEMIWLVEVADDLLSPMIVYGGEVFDVFRDWQFEFVPDDAGVLGLELRLDTGELVLTGRR